MATKNKADSDDPITPSIVGLGYPLVDLLSTTIYPSSFGLVSGETVLATSSAAYCDLFSQLVHSQDTKIIAGGSTLNSIRILQWLFSTIAFENAAAFIGCVGNDRYSQLLQSAMLSDFVIPILEVAQVEEMGDEMTCDSDNDNKEILSTGTSGVLISPSTGERTLVTFLGASKYLSQSFTQSKEPWKVLTNCRWVFSCGFMCQSSAPEHYQIASLVAKMSSLKVGNCGFAMNIGAPYICRNFTKQLFSLLFLSDIIFANKDEAFALAEAAGWMSLSTTLEEIARKIAELRDETETESTMVYKTRRIVALTCGKDPTVCALFDLSTSPCAISFSIPIHPDDIVPNEKIVDLTGAGDAFAGGFIAYVIKSSDPHIYTRDCILNATRIGHWAASRVVRSQGATWVKDEGKKCPFL